MDIEDRLGNLSLFRFFCMTDDFVSGKGLSLIYNNVHVADYYREIDRHPFNGLFSRTTWAGNYLHLP